jgi:plastocyanin
MKTKPSAFIVVSLLFLLTGYLTDTTPISMSPRVEAQDDKEIYSSTGQEGSVLGVIHFEGTPPGRRKIDMAADPNCNSNNQTRLTEDVIVRSGRLANVFVYVKSGEAIEKYRFQVPDSEVWLDQKGCRFVPRVLGVQAGQVLRILNGDPAAHNIHPYPKNNPEWNRSQPPGGASIEVRFNRPEVMIPIKCNQHPWMKALVGVLSHSFFAVSDRNGAFSISGLPPGDYKIAASHEVYGEQFTEIRIGPGESKTLNFTFNARGGYTPTSLRMDQALVLR